MNKKYSFRKVLVFPCVLILSVSVFSGFGTQEETGEVLSLIEKRTEILQQAYYGEIDLKSAEAELWAIETQPLLAEDIFALRSADPAQLDLVTKMEMKSIEKKINLFYYQSYEVYLKWYMKGLSADYVSQGTYFVVLKDMGNKYKLSKFGPGQVPDS